MSHPTHAADTPWMTRAAAELADAAESWSAGNAGRGRVCARRAAGMALKAWLEVDPRPGYGTSFMHHLGALADDESVEVAAREAAWRLAARQPPAAGFAAPLPERLTPMHDAELIRDWCAARLAAAGS